VRFSTPIDLLAALERQHIEFLTVTDQRYFAIFEQTVFDCRDPTPSPDAATTMTVRPAALPDEAELTDSADWETRLDRVATVLASGTDAQASVHHPDSEEC